MTSAESSSYPDSSFQDAKRSNLPLVHPTHSVLHRHKKPQRLSAEPRNLTGVFLGVEGTATAQCSKGSKKIPVMVRGTPSSRPRTPTELKRCEEVEQQLRVKEEKRGFCGQLLKKKSADGTQFERLPQSSRNDASPTHLNEIIRQTHRNFTIATNSGFSRLEYLQTNRARSSFRDPERREQLLDADISQQIHRLAAHKKEDNLAGLIECYKKVCKGKMDALQPLMPRGSKKQRPLGLSSNRTEFSSGSFAVKGYRNPSSAEICASFPQLQRPQTVGAGTGRSLQQLLLMRRPPQTEPRTTPALPPDTPHTHVDGAAGSEYRPTLRDDPASENSMHEKPRCSVHTDNEPSEEEASVVAPLLSEMKAASKFHPAEDVGGVSVGIMIGLEDEAGSAAPVEIDEADENMRAEEEAPQPIEPKVPANRGRRVSITERVLKSKNSEMQLASIKFTAQCRKQQLADLLDEHAQLVTQVSEMEDDRSSQGKENAQQ